MIGGTVYKSHQEDGAGEARDSVGYYLGGFLF
jgi:hypothetical protein